MTLPTPWGPQPPLFATARLAEACEGGTPTRIFRVSTPFPDIGRFPSLLGARA